MSGVWQRYKPLLFVATHLSRLSFYTTELLGAILLISAANPWVFLVSAPLAIMFVLIRNYYLKTGREIKVSSRCKEVGGANTVFIPSPAPAPALTPLTILIVPLLQRLEAVLRSPMYSHISASLQGAATIRSQGGGARAVSLMHGYQDDHGSGYYMFLTVSRWLGFRLDFLTFFLMLVVSFSSVPLRDTLDPSLVGLSLVYTLRMTGSFQWCVRQSAEVESLMTSVERALEYTHLVSEADPSERLEEERRRESKELKRHHHRKRALSTSSDVLKQEEAARATRLGICIPPPSWPECGALTFDKVRKQICWVVLLGFSCHFLHCLPASQNSNRPHPTLLQVTLCYSPDLPPALHDVSFDVNVGDKVGVVGRTGAGKSSLLAAIFRLSPTTGRILLDGVDLATVPLNRLRSSISVIPQDPVLFSGSMRYNLDPFSAYTDADLWRSLEAVQLKDVVAGLPGGRSPSSSSGLLCYCLD